MYGTPSAFSRCRAVFPEGEGDYGRIVGIEGRQKQVFEGVRGLVGKIETRKCGKEERPSGKGFLHRGDAVEARDGVIGNAAAGGDADQGIPFFYRVGIQVQGERRSGLAGGEGHPGRKHVVGKLLEDRIGRNQRGYTRIAGGSRFGVYRSRGQCEHEGQDDSPERVRRPAIPVHFGVCRESGTGTKAKKP